ncbi:Activating molecule in BECN1-regulated autophagy protein 1 [Morus notabilis]|uniref:Activating molecule in BECN1-regulated autophagy protein 1 n=1 Tax=Morus notabilis TaxID=981085 RepID=W9S8F6_9ROSA|nr:Activating molecule in BECN1-regulated autophagy protein 1 [Morus notabilis]
MGAPLWADEANAPSTSTSRISPANPPSRRRVGNVFQLLARREVSPQTTHLSKRLWGETSKCHLNFARPRCDAARNARHGLVSWVEAESLRHLSAKYCPLLPPPRSTIAAAFSPDGKTLASTHGDHTVKIIDCRSGSCLKVLSGHRRTPWVRRPTLKRRRGLQTADPSKEERPLKSRFLNLPRAPRASMRPTPPRRRGLHEEGSYLPRAPRGIHEADPSKEERPP